MTAPAPATGPAPIQELHYRLAGTVAGARPGAHRSRSGSSGFEFRSHASLADAPDARRLDLHASLRDPFGNWLVRQNSEARAITVAVVADLSASMAFEGAQRKLAVLADLVQSLAWSAWRHGDSFAFVGADEVPRRDWLLQPSRSRAAGLALAQRLRGAALTGRGAAGLQQASAFLPARRSLVFLVSDFHLPLADVQRVLDGLALHQVQPVVLWQPAEFALAAPQGLALVRDPEGRGSQWLWWRPALRQRWSQAHDERRAALMQLFRQRRLAPLFIEGAFDARAVTRHFMA